MGQGGLEPGRETTGKTSDSKVGGAESGAVSDEIGPIDPDLRHVIEAWPRLSDEVKAGILAELATTARLNERGRPGQRI